MRASRHLVLFVRAPRYGAGKTRLARSIGTLEAWRFQRGEIFRLARALGRDARWRTVLAVTPDAYARTGSALPRGLPRRAQGPGDLGRRMARCLRALPPGPRLLVGADIPALDPRHIAQGFAALGNAEAVFGPARDGGFWLVGVRGVRLLSGLFSGVVWSEGRTLEQTLANLPKGTRYALLEELADVDEVADRASARGR